jgi:hypothetical protein
MKELSDYSKSRHKHDFFPSFAGQSVLFCTNGAMRLMFFTVIYRIADALSHLFYESVYFMECALQRLNRTHVHAYPARHTAKTKCRKFETNIPRKGISGPQSQFPHSCVCELLIYSHDGSACSAGGNM